MDMIVERVELIIKCISFLKEILNLVMEFLPDVPDKTWQFYNGQKRS